MKFILVLAVTAFLTSTVAMAEGEDHGTISGYWDKVGRRPTSDTEQVVPENQPWWSPENQKYSIGYETAGATVLNTFAQSTFGQNAIVFGAWRGNWGLDFYFGYTKAAQTFNEEAKTADDAVTNGRVYTDAFTGVKTANNFILGVGLKQRILQNSWFQLNWGPVFAFTTPNSVSYQVGTHVDTYASKDVAGNYTITETGYGTKQVDTNLAVAFGPRIGTEFYLKWFPHLALGFATGILATVGGDVTTTTTTVDRKVDVVNGVAQAPTTQSSTNDVSKSPGGLRAATFGVGGTSFSFTGVFSLRYIW